MIPPTPFEPLLRAVLSPDDTATLQTSLLGHTLGQVKRRRQQRRRLRACACSFLGFLVVGIVWQLRSPASADFVVSTSDHPPVAVVTTTASTPQLSSLSRTVEVHTNARPTGLLLINDQELLALVGSSNKILIYSGLGKIDERDFSALRTP